ncbi:endopeptidase Clp [Jeotgalibacillus malaysiensis]|uniref:ATP-dependent Clp protease proteolytic subunit n=1 Tax=Jeotgalibacillus malaysiensis TaxID=1508404 RepID=A0A0B5APL1_9BACL|nr:head maturation protease, ClpP-related [Jeotgalibacillus malaysiensis]AJD92036.1 endopeptidase Clp [Jeotgalibacillus malaysiensis]
MKKLKINGPIIPNDYQEIYDWFDMEATSPAKVSSFLDANSGKDIEISINSGGGDVHSGSDIYTAIREHDGNVTVKVTGIAASAASVIAMAGDRVLMSPTAEMMIHNASMIAWGDDRTMSHAADILSTTNKVVANAYILKTGKAQDDLLEMMKKETWMSAQEAKKQGFIDEVMFDTNNQLIASSSKHLNMLPPEVIEKFKNDKQQNKPDPKKDEAILMQKKRAIARTNTIKLGGIKS